MAFSGTKELLRLSSMSEDIKQILEKKLHECKSLLSPLYLRCFLDTGCGASLLHIHRMSAVSNYQCMRAACSSQQPVTLLAFERDFI